MLTGGWLVQAERPSSQQNVRKLRISLHTNSTSMQASANPGIFMAQLGMLSLAPAR